jgi:hypothetical protein
LKKSFFNRFFVDNEVRMKKKYITCILGGIILFFLTANVHAWDGQRKGFLLGFGVGAGMTPFVEYDPTYSDESKLLLKTDFKIGYAPDNFWQIYWMSKVFWFKSETYRYGYYYGYYKSSDLAMYGLGGLGVTYSIRPQAPSPFLTGGIGYSSLGTLSTTEYSNQWDAVGKPEYGFGFFVGAGYEFARHLNAELDLSYQAPSDNDDWNGLTFSLTFNVLGY